MGPGFSGPGDSWITAWTRLQVGMVNILPAWHYPLPFPPTPQSRARLPWLSEFMASSCSVVAIWTLSWVAVWYTAGWSSLASPALQGVVMGNGREGGGPVLVSLSTCHPSTFLVCILFKRRGRDIKGWRRLYVTYPFLNKYLLFLPLSCYFFKDSKWPCGTWH